MNNFKIAKFLVVKTAVLWISSAQAAVDSYRFMHVTISTPWYIFIFLLMGIFAPFVLMVILAWTSAARKKDNESADTENNSNVK